MVRPEDENAGHLIASELGCSPFCARLLVNRGMASPEEASAFLHPSFDHLADPMLLPDAEAAVERLRQALATGERIAIHGDYDADGVTSAALWHRLLERLGARVSVHVPHRRNDGYDLRSPFVAQAQADGVKLIITTDCGVRRVDEVEEAREAGVDVIVTDHHEPGGALPRAVAVVNPHRTDSRYPFPHLAGVGVAYRLGEALVRRLGKPVASYRRAYGDLAAVGTVTDIMPVLGENRVIVKHGLESLRDTQKAGLQALLRSSSLASRPLSAHHISFMLGPRLNAIGRLDDAQIALDLLLCRDAARASELAGRLEAANNDRRQKQAEVLAQALEQAAQLDLSETRCLVLSGEEWHSGVIGPVANRVMERFNRPVVLIAVDAETGLCRGSARSIRPFDIHQAISECADQLIEFGGHAHAAGLAIRTDDLASFARRMNELAVEQLSDEDLEPSLDIEAEADPCVLTLDLMRELAMFEPWGRGNEEPLVMSRGMQILDVCRVGKEQNHLKLVLRCDGLNPTDAMMWQAGDLADHLQRADRLDICYRFRVNHFNGHAAVEYFVEDLRPSE